MWYENEYWKACDSMDFHTYISGHSGKHWPLLNSKTLGHRKGSWRPDIIHDVFGSFCSHFHYSKIEYFKCHCTTVISYKWISKVDRIWNVPSYFSTSTQWVLSPFFSILKQANEEYFSPTASGASGHLPFRLILITGFRSTQSTSPNKRTWGSVWDVVWGWGITQAA